MTVANDPLITPELLAGAFNYKEYFDLVSELVKSGKTTGPKQSESLIHYSKLNFQRMKRIYKTTRINDPFADIIQSVERAVVWLMLVESWCGDVAQNLPVFAKVAEMSGNIDLRIILRDENLQIMDAHLTNGGRAIPKLIMYDATSLEKIGTWGPRPVPFQKMAMQQKDNPTLPYKEFSKLLQEKYLKDQTQTLQLEIAGLLQQICVPMING